MTMTNDNPEGHRPSLKDAWSGNCEIAVIDSGNLSDIGMLEDAYNALFVPTFGSDPESEKLHNWEHALRNPAESRLDYRIVIAGTDLRDPEKRVLKGMNVSLYDKKMDIGFLAYIVVDPQFRTEGLGHQLFKIQQLALFQAAQENGKSLRGWFLDCNKPDTEHDREDNYCAQKRLDKYFKWGAREVPLETYSIPSSIDPSRKITDWTLLAFPHPVTGQYPDKEAVIDLIRLAYTRVGITKPKHDPDYVRMTQEIHTKWVPHLQAA
jgi:hypothetical protein